VRLTPRGAGVAAVGLTAVIATLAGAAGATSRPGAVVLPAFQASASALAAEFLVTVPGGPVSDTPVDSGGPTAQATLDSFGGGVGYAAFPDPGATIGGLPGLAAGLLATGAAGLPPISAPVPSYPLAVTADSTHSEASAGAGSYSLHATQSAHKSTSSATAGVQVSAVGNAGLASSTTSITQDADGTVLVEAVTDVQGVTIGPLNIGEIRSRAAYTLDPGTGIITPETSIDVDGMKVGGLPLAVNGAGLNVFGAQTVPLPIDATLSTLLAAGNVTVKTAAPQMYPNRVVAPAIQISGPVPGGAGLGLGTAPPTYVLTIGAATASLQGTVPDAISSEVVPPTVNQNPATPPGAIPNSPAGTTTPPAGIGAIPPVSGSDLAAGTVDQGGVAPPVTAPQAAAAGQGVYVVSPASAQVPASFDISTLYLLVAVLGAVALGTGLMIRLLGVRGPWTSSAG
jgi:hypothetical protein